MSRRKYKLVKYALTLQQRERIAERLIKVIKRRYPDKEADFLEHYGLAPGTFGHWKDGKLNPAFLIRLSKDFDVDLTWLLRGIPPEEFPADRLVNSRKSED
jgi:hypothetical protein